MLKNNIHIDGDFKYTVSNGQAEIVKYVGNAITLAIPAVLDGNIVTSIGQEAFSECRSLMNVVIPDCIETIGDAAFSWCLSLKVISMPANLKTIGNSVFSGCELLKNVYISSDVETIGEFAFSDCKSLESIYIPESVKSIGVHTFLGCKSLKSIMIPDSVEEIGRSAFSGCESLENIAIPNGVVEIESDVFSGCNSLISIVIPSNVKSIGEFAFSGCRSLKNINIPVGIEEIGVHTFLGCSALESIEIPGGVEKIGRSAFYNCSSLKNVSISEGVKEIGGFAFYGCSSLKSIALPSSIKKVADSAFLKCTSLSNVLMPKDMEQVANRAFKNCNLLNEEIDTIQKVETVKVKETKSIEKPIVKKTVEPKVLKVKGATENVAQIMGLKRIILECPNCKESNSVNSGSQQYKCWHCATISDNELYNSEHAVEIKPEPVEAGPVVIDCPKCKKGNQVGTDYRKCRCWNCKTIFKNKRYVSKLPSYKIIRLEGVNDDVRQMNIFSCDIKTNVKLVCSEDNNTIAIEVLTIEGTPLGWIPKGEVAQVYSMIQSGEKVYIGISSILGMYGGMECGMDVFVTNDVEKCFLLLDRAKENHIMRMKKIGRIGN